MRLEIKNLLGIPITISKIDVTLEEIVRSLKKRGHTIDQTIIIYTPNPEISSFSTGHTWYKQILAKAQINIPDGQGIVWALKHLYGVSAKRISGVDFCLKLSEAAAKEGFRIGLIGSASGVALKASECLRQTYKNIDIESLDAPEVRYQNSEFRIQQKGEQLDEQKYFEQLVKTLEDRKIDILFVALGFPKQEWFIDRIRNQESGIRNRRPIVLMAVGGALDYISGTVPRAPAWMREHGLEWLFRLTRQPWRLGRQLAGGRFFLKVLFG
jgi:N-acetylglucosaminyldiphosphoundecaprenol N-acetyl-beta-D-mannosaminyltransferase